MDSWEESRKYIEKTLERLEEGQHALAERLEESQQALSAKVDSMKEEGQRVMLGIHQEIARLKERSTLWGGFSGLLVSMAFVLITYFLKK